MPTNKVLQKDLKKFEKMKRGEEVLTEHSSKREYGGKSLWDKKT